MREAKFSVAYDRMRTSKVGSGSALVTLIVTRCCYICHPVAGSKYTMDVWATNTNLYYRSTLN